MNLGNTKDGKLVLRLWQRSTTGKKVHRTLTINTVTAELISDEAVEEDISNEELLGVTVEQGMIDGKPVRIIRPTGDPAAAFRDSVLNPDVPCPVGYEDIRRSYEASVKAAEEASGGTCRDCELGEIRRQHLRLALFRQRREKSA